MALMVILVAITLVRYRWWQEADTQAYYLTRQLRQAQNHYRMLYDDWTLAQQRQQQIIADIRQEQAQAHDEAQRKALAEDLRAAQQTAAALAQRYHPTLEEISATIKALHLDLELSDSEETQP